MGSTKLYAASVWTWAAKELGITKQQGTIQRGIAQNMCKAYHSVFFPWPQNLWGTIAVRGLKWTLDLIGGWEGRTNDHCHRGSLSCSTRHLKVRKPEKEQLNNSCIFNIRTFTDGSKIGRAFSASLSIQKGQGSNLLYLDTTRFTWLNS